MPDKIVKWGILSTARINQRLIPAIQESANADMYAVASRNMDKATEYAKEWSIPNAFGSYEDLLADPDIDVVYIPLPNDMHAEWTIKAMEAGKHVLCEKPMFMTMDEFDRVEKVAAETGCYVAEAFMYLHHPQTTFIKSLVDEGVIGDLRRMSGTFSYMYSREKENYRLSKEQGGGAIWDVGVYPISFFQYIMGKEPEKVSATFKMHDGIDMCCWGQLTFDEHVTAHMFSSFDAAFSTLIELHGTIGSLRVTRPFTNTHMCEVFVEIDDVIRKERVPYAALYAGEVEDMNNVVLNGAQPKISLDQSRAHLRTVLRMLECAKKD